MTARPKATEQELAGCEHQGVGGVGRCQQVVLTAEQLVWRLAGRNESGRFTAGFDPEPWGSALGPGPCCLLPDRVGRGRMNC